MRSRGASATININLERQTLEAGNYRLTNSSDSGTIEGSRSVATTSGGAHVSSVEYGGCSDYLSG